jgi:hypothetical protein
MSEVKKDDKPMKITPCEGNGRCWYWNTKIKKFMMSKFHTCEFKCPVPGYDYCPQCKRPDGLMLIKRNKKCKSCIVSEYDPNDKLDQMFPTANKLFDGAM